MEGVGREGGDEQEGQEEAHRPGGEAGARTDKSTGRRKSRRLLVEGEVSKNEQGQPLKERKGEWKGGGVKRFGGQAMQPSARVASRTTTWHPCTFRALSFFQAETGS